MKTVQECLWEMDIEKTGGFVSCDTIHKQRNE